MKKYSSLLMYILIILYSVNSIQNHYPFESNIDSILKIKPQTKYYEDLKYQEIGKYQDLNDKEIKVCKALFIKKNSEVGKVYASKNNLEIGCKDGVISLEIVKPMGKNEMNIKAFLNGIDKENLYVNN